MIKHVNTRAEYDESVKSGKVLGDDASILSTASRSLRSAATGTAETPQERTSASTFSVCAVSRL